MIDPTATVTLFDVTRVEVIDENGRSYTKYLDKDQKVCYNIQDDGRTLREWWPKVKKGGIFAGHDYSKTSWPKTVEQVDRFAKDNNLKLEFTEENFASWYCIK